MRAGKRGEKALQLQEASPHSSLGSGLWETHMLQSGAVRASTLSPDTDSLGLALPVAFGCHGSRKDEEKCKHLASRCRNLTGSFPDYQQHL